MAALRAQFPISPSENWAHEGRGARAGVSSFHWGTGSGMAGIELEDEGLRDAVVDVAAGRGVGVNGLDLTECIVAGDRIRLSLGSPFRWSRQPVVLFRHAVPSRRYRLLVNGAALGSYTGEAPEKGIPVPVPSHDVGAAPNGSVTRSLVVRRERPGRVGNIFPTGNTSPTSARGFSPVMT